MSVPVPKALVSKGQLDVAPNQPLLNSKRILGPSHSKVRTGCVTCKARRIKCDERKPTCLRCIKSGRVCEGYNPPKTLIFEIPSKPRFDSPVEGRLFQYFLEKTIPYLSGWGESVSPFAILCPQIGDEHSSVRHALVAIAAVQETSEARHVSAADPLEFEARRIFTLAQYDKAIKQLTGPVSSQAPVVVILICCVLFSLYEMFQFDDLNHVSHIFAGLKIFNQLQQNQIGRRQTVSGTPVDVLGKTLHRMAIATTAFDDNAFDEESWYTDEHLIENGLVLPVTFSSMHQAFERLDALNSCIFRATSASSKATATTLQQIETTIPLFIQRFASSSETLQSATEPGFHSGALQIKTHHTVGAILFETLRTNDEMVYAKFTEDFRIIVSSCREVLSWITAPGNNPIVTVSVIPPLFLVATKCRDSKLRRHALSVLHAAPRRERLWTSCTAAQVAAEIIRIEEHNFAWLKDQKRKVEAGRIKLVGIQLYKKKRRARLTYQLAPWDETAEIRSRTIEWSPDLDSKSSTNHDEFTMPRKVVRLSGYSNGAFLCTETRCHCTKPFDGLGYTRFQTTPTVTSLQPFFKDLPNSQ